MLYSILKLRIKQVVGPFAGGSILKFLAPDFLVGLFIALSNGNNAETNSATLLDLNYSVRLWAVSVGISLFTSIVETRKLFFVGGEVEDFYFIQPTKISRFASLLATMLLDLAVIFSVVVPSLLFVSPDPASLARIMAVSVSAFLISSTLYLIIVSFISLLPKRIANSSLTFVQILAALILLSVFQLPLFSENLFDLGDRSQISEIFFLISCVLFLFSIIMFLFFPIQENLISNFKERESSSVANLLSVIEKCRKFLFVRSNEEEAGLLFFCSNLLRNQSFRLSTIGTAATPIMVAVYWSLRGFHFVGFGLPGGFMVAELVAPLASLVVTGILAHYFLAQTLLSSKDYDAAWLFSVNPQFRSGKFVSGIRKGLLTTVHIPVTIVIFLVAFNRDTFLESLIAALTFYFLTHVAVSFFSMVQKTLPFTLPFTQIISSGAIDLIFLFAYPIVVTFALFICYGGTESLLMLNLFAFILVCVLEFLSGRIIDKRIKLGF